MITVTARLKDANNGNASVAVKVKRACDDKVLNSLEIVAILRGLRDTFDDAFMTAMDVFIQEEIGKYD